MLTMTNKLSNKTLGIAFALLAIIAAILFLFDSGKNERSFKANLVDIDTAAVTKLVITPKTKDKPDIEIYQEDGAWRVKLSEDKSAPVPNDKFKGLLTQLLEVKPKRLAAHSRSRWGEYQVDSSGTRVQVFEGSSKTLDLTIGKFNFQQQPRSMTTFVRLTNEIDVFEVDGFLDVTFNREINSFRNDRILKGTYTDFKNIKYEFASGITDDLKKEGNTWFFNGLVTDSAKTVDVLRKISNLRGSEYLDGYSPAEGVEPDVKITVTDNADLETVVNVFPRDTSYVINSSINPESFFDGSKLDLYKKLVINKADLFK